VTKSRQDRSAARIAESVAAAAAALGQALADPVLLQGDGDWTMVLRCRDVAAAADPAGASGPAGASVVVKSYPDSADGAANFAAEAAGLSLAGGTGLAPEILAADAGRLVVVMTDLGSGPTMADLLLGESATEARAAVLDWANACGELSATTFGRLGEFGGLLARYTRGEPARSFADVLPESILGAADRATQLGVTAPPGLAADLADVARNVRPDRYPVFSPGDLCPDNNLVTPAGIRLLDFEAAAIYSVFLDAAYIRMPFSTCWCVFRLPAELGAAAERAYREHACRAWPELADDGIWQHGLRRGIAAWTMNSMGWLLRESLRGDRPLDDVRTSPSTRQLMRHRWSVLASELEAGNELPALAEFGRSLLAATQGWQVAELPLYPALR
jgi:Phosphotransferase enzyme family